MEGRPLCRPGIVSRRLTHCLIPLAVALLAMQATGQSFFITGDRSISGRCDLAWENSATRYILEASTDLASPFAYAGGVISTSGASIQFQSLPPAYFVRVRTVSLVNVPDTALRQAVIASIAGKLEPTNEVYGMEVARVRSVDSGGNQVRSAAGIGQFTNLETFVVANSRFTNTLDLSSNVVLRQLNCSGSTLSNLNITGLNRLETINCAGNSLQNMNVGGWTNLSELYCYGNILTNLVVAGCTALGQLECDSNRLSRLDLSGCSNLWELSCFSNSLSALDVSPSPDLKLLFANDNALSSLNMSSHGKLEELYCYNNVLTNINLSGCTNLVALSCMNNNITRLNLSGCANLRYLYCSNNVLTNLTLTGCTSLEYLRCERNAGLKTLNVSACTNLLSLRCFGNSMTGTLDVSRSPGLTELLAHKTVSLAYIKIADITNPPAIFQYEYTTTIIGP